MIITLYTDSKVGDVVKLGRLHFVDLAGGEKINEALNAGDTVQDVTFINKSLHAFGDVLFALSNSTTLLRKKSSMRMSMADMLQYQQQQQSATAAASTPVVPPTPSPNGKDLARKNSMRFSLTGGETVAIPSSPAPTPKVDGMGHIPYLNSKITHLLKNSLGGNGKTTMILNIAPENESYHQTVVVYEYAARGRKIMNLPTPNRYELSQVRYDPNSELSILRQLKMSLYTPAQPGDRKRSNILIEKPPPTPSGKNKAVFFTVSNIIVENLPYLCFPLHPWVTMEIGSNINRTTP